MREWLLSWVPFLAALLLSPLLPGLINKVKAFFAGRRGPSVFQLYYDLAKLLKKGAIYSRTTAGMLQLAAPAVLATTLVALFLLDQSELSGGYGKMIVFFYLLSAGRLLMIWGALDTGSSFEGMGATREAQFGALAEPTILVILGLIFTADQLAPGCLLLAALAFFLVLLCENSRVPFDDPETHLELTMVHEAMLLDYAGPDLGFMLYAASLKLWAFGAFLAVVVLPGLNLSWTVTPLGQWLGQLAIVLLATLVVGVVESIMARCRLLKIPQLLATALVIALVAVGLGMVLH